MSDYNTSHQYEPLRAPSSWSAEERRLLVQLTDIFDDIYRRYGRLRMEDMSKAFQTRIADGETAISTVEQTAEGLSATVEGMSGDVAQVKLTTQGLTAAVNNNRIAFSASGLTVKNAQGTTVFSQDNATGNLDVTGNITASGGTIGGFTINSNGLSYGQRFILRNGDSPLLYMDGLTVTGGNARSLRYDDNNLIYFNIAEGAVAFQGAVSINQVPVPKIARGTVIASGSTAGYMDYSAGRFSAIPTVVATFSSAGPNTSGDFGSIKIYSKGTAGAYVILGGDSGSMAIDWVAVGV